MTIPHSTTEDNATFTVRATNDYGVTECSAEVTVQYQAPAFVEPLKDTPVIVNETATLTCRVSGVPEPEAKWLVSGLEVPSGEKYRSEHHEDTYTLSINNVSMDDTEMEYTVKAVNPVGEATSSARLLPQGVLVFLCHLTQPSYPWCSLYRRKSCLLIVTDVWLPVPCLSS